MFVAFFDSVKYVGHLIPIAFLRVFLGYFYLDSALRKFESDFLYRPNLADELAALLPTLTAPIWYRAWVHSIFIPQWKTVAFIVTAIEFAIAFSYLFGYVVRPVALLGALLALNQLALSLPGQEQLSRTLIAIHLTLAWVGAGRCLGVDYYFFKRRRGLWW